MGTRCDWYVGRGKDAKWRGSLAWDGYPDNDDYAPILAATTQRAFDAALLDLARRRHDWSSTDHGWPWPWDDSGTTDYAYAFDGGRVWVSCFGSRWWPASEPEPEGLPDKSADPERAVFPDMSAVKHVAYDRRSGLLFIGGPAREPASGETP